MTAQDWDSPVKETEHLIVLDQLKERDLHAGKMDYSSDTHVPTGMIKSDSGDSDKLKRFDGVSWNPLSWITSLFNHIADTSLHSGVASGTLVMWPGASVPTGHLLCDGSAVSRTTYANLFAAIGTLWGVGDGTTTFNLPNGVGKMFIGKNAAVAAIDTVGKTTGSWDHTHSTPNHTHTIAGHTHDMSSHTHQVGAHQHTIPAHNHTVPGHYHNSRATGADINITSSGSHQHNIARGPTGGSSGSSRVGLSDGTSAASTTSVSDSTSNHVHANSAFSGKVGLVTGGVDGDSGAMTTGNNAAALITDNSSAFASGAPSTANTASSGTLTSNSGEGGSTSGAANPPVFVGLWCIKT